MLSYKLGTHSILERFVNRLGFHSVVFLFCLAAFSHLASAQENLVNRLVLVEAPGKSPEVIKAATVEIRELVVVTTDESGKRSALQRDFYKGSAPFFTEDSGNATIPEVESVLQEFQQLARESSDFKELLVPEELKWRDQLAELKRQQEKAAQEKLDEINTQVDDFLTRPYDISEEYTLKMLQRLMELGESLSNQAPDRASEITEFLKPWVAHSTELEAGNILHEGVWVTPQELAEIKEATAREAINKFLEEGLEIQMESVVVPQTSMLLSGGLIIMTLVLVLYMFLYLASSRGGTLTFGGAIFLLIGIAIIGGYGYYGYQILNAPASIEEYLNESEVETNEPDMLTLERALFVSGNPKGLQLEETDLEVNVSDMEVNKLLKEDTDFVREGESELFDMERVAFATFFLNDRVIFLDEAVVFGKSFLIRYELAHRISDDLIAFDGVTVYFGGVKLPGQLLNYFWMKLRQDLKGMIEATGISEIYELASISEGYISLVMTQKPQDTIHSESNPTGTE
ncbi:MAG: hypothetical protein AAGH72_00655 [Verrucomicrobiota bacterium]